MKKHAVYSVVTNVGGEMEIGIIRFYTEPKVHFLFSQRHCFINCGSDSPTHPIKYIWLDYILN